MSPEENTVTATSILVWMRSPQRTRLISRLEEMRWDKRQLFPGTIAHYFIEKQRQQEHIEILLIWLDTAMSDETIYNRWLSEFQQVLSDVLDWETAQYDTGKVNMPT
jgi:hypothetical protein